MAIPYELATLEQRQLDRAARARKKDSWPLDTKSQRLQQRAAGLADQLCQKLEDLLVPAPAEALAAETERWRVGVRAAIKIGREQYKQLEVGVKGGEEAVEQVCEPKLEVEGMTDEELKRWKLFNKKTGGGKITGVRKVGAAATAATAATAAAAPAAAVPKVGGGVAPGWGGYFLPQQYPYQQQSQFQQQGGWAADSWGGGGVQYQLPGSYQQDTGRASKAQKVARFPCDNCGQIGHWSYSMECPNYDVYLAKQKAKSEAMKSSQKSGGGGAAGGSGTIALRNIPGRHNTNRMSLVSDTLGFNNMY